MVNAKTRFMLSANLEYFHFRPCVGTMTFHRLLPTLHVFVVFYLPSVVVNLDNFERLSPISANIPERCRVLCPETR